MKVQTGKGTISLLVLLAIWSVSAITSLPGLAISPLLDRLNQIFPHSSELEVQMLDSLPSLLIIPFVLLSGFLSAGRDNLRLLYVGLAIFFAAGTACLLADSISMLILLSCLLGIGAGMVIPLSTGLVVRYFTGEYRVRQLGYSSAINNLTLVVATAVVGYLADADWHLAFIVYTLPGISLLLCLALRNSPTAPEPPESDQLQHTHIDTRRLAGIGTLYFLITFAVLVISFYLTFLTAQYHISSRTSGLMISCFFLAIMLPGTMLNGIIRRLRSLTNIISLAMICCGLLLIWHTHHVATLFLGVTFAGLGYGIMQPIIYDKAATIAPPHLATKALSVVMTVNYVAIVLCPLIFEALRHVVGMGAEVPFMISTLLSAALLVVALFARKNFTWGLDNSYYIVRR